MGLQNHLKRPSLGRVAFIGELYDVRNESLSSLSVLNHRFPQDLIETSTMNEMRFEYKFTENASDRFELIDAQAEIQLSVFFGLIKVEGSGKFLSEEKKSGKTVRCSLLCQLQTVNQKFFATLDEVLKYIDLSQLENTKYTHMISEINWGANLFLDLELACGSESSKEAIRGRLAAEFTKLKGIGIKGGGQLEKAECSLLKNEDLKIKVFADVMPVDSWPTTVEGFFQFVEKVPKLLNEVNDGKGKPLSYTMIPLSTIRKLAKLELAVDVTVKKIDESFFMSTLYFFEEVDKMKQRFHDLCALMGEKVKYVKEESLKGARRMKEQLATMERKLKSIISEDWVAVRSGEKTLKELIVKVEKFKSTELRLFSYEEYLESLAPSLGKLSVVSQCLSIGILYLGKGDRFQTVQLEYPSFNFVVLVTSSEMQSADLGLHRKTFHYFFTLVADSEKNTKYVILDFDFTDEETIFGRIGTVTKCFRLNGMQILSRDLFAEYMKEIKGNFMRLKKGSKMELCHHKPGNRTTLEMPCPGFEERTCSSEALTWSCYDCKKNIEHAFDSFNYCSCGRALAVSFEYRCSNPKHGNYFISANEDFLTDALSKLRPLKEMNLLVIGQSGVGKSTWINSIVNYLSYESFDAAQENGVICTIPATFTFYHPKTYKKYELKIGHENENEVRESGESATQQSRTYNFLWEGTRIRIIDTPGLGDTRGIDQDKKNLSNIIHHLGYMKELHGVCILLRANDNRFNAIFTYCIKELLVHLHKSVTRNIVFCFTNSRTSLYSPGQSAAILEKLISGLGIEKELGLGTHNMFCLDNESFAFLCALQKTDIKYDELILKSFVESWRISLAETQRLFQTVKTFRPHLLLETLSLVKARNRILSLTKPIAEVSKTIQINVTAMQRKQKEIEAAEMTLQELEKKLNYTEIHLLSVPLARPRTVCTSPSCVDYHSYQSVDVSEIEYKTHCHTECYLEEVTPKTVNNPQLKDCWAIGDDGKCRICGCSWAIHMHLTYDQKRVEKPAENKFIKENMLKEEEQKKKTEDFVEGLRGVVDKYKKEQKIILQASVKFGMFLRNNAITPYNDSVAEYLEYLIEEERKKPYKSETEKRVLESLDETLARYNAEVKILQEAMKENDGKVEEVTPKEVCELEEQLYSLELTGAALRESVELSRSGINSVHQYSEVPVRISRKQRKTRSYIPSFLTTLFR